jgi:CRP/FNR family transcriptional regulator, cyclic AMP receptor protein
MLDVVRRLTPLTHPSGLHPMERRGVDEGRWFAGLPADLRQAILACARVAQLRRGARLADRGGVASDWVGVASGALRLAAGGADGRDFTLNLLGPGDWYGDVALLDGGNADLDIVAQVQSTVLLVGRAALLELVQSQPELRGALLQLHCRRLRYMFRRLEELQTLPLAQRVALQLTRLLRQFGRPLPADAAPGCADAQQIGLALTQGDLASLLGASRQRINAAMRQLQAAGIVVASRGRLVVLQPRRLDDLAQGRKPAAVAGARRGAA